MFGQKRQYPLQHDEESVREPGQEIDVHDRPDNPRRKSGESEQAKIGEPTTFSYLTRPVIIELLSIECSTHSDCIDFLVARNM